MAGLGIDERELRVAIGHPRLGWGGSEKRVMWGIEALKDIYDLTLITAGDFDLDDLNRYYGTSLQPTDFKLRQTPLPFFLRNNATAAALRGALYQRFCRRIAPEYDILISAYGPCDFGVPAIHFIADFSWSDEIRKILHPRAPGLIYKNNLLRKCYLWIAKSLRNPSGRNLFGGEDMIITVSKWAAKLMKEKYHVECPIIHPAVPGDYPVVPFESRKFDFACLGRIAPEKRVERIIEILKKLRGKGHNFCFHIIGEPDNASYAKYFHMLISKYSDWIIHEGRLFGENKIKLLSAVRFGIHACQGDAFPGAVAEMVKAGCITFVPSEGGQAEIVDHKSLMYDSIEDAVEKIDAVLRKPQLQGELREHLKKQGSKFSTNAFMDGLRAAVEKFLSASSRQKSF